jgi:hypothetical protein
MKRKTETALIPILVTSAGDHEGEAFLLGEKGGEAELWRSPTSVHVRRFGDGDFVSAMKQMGGTQVHLLGLIRLKAALVSKNKEEVANGRQQLCAYVSFLQEQRSQLFRFLGEPAGATQQIKKAAQAVPRYPAGSMWETLARVLRQPAGFEEECQMLIERYTKEEAATLLAREMAGAMVGVRVVLWKTGKRFMPALLCEEFRTAAYTFALFAGRWKVCPYSGCGAWFKPSVPKQECCCPAHTDARRVARWRATRKRKK